MTKYPSILIEVIKYKVYPKISCHLCVPVFMKYAKCFIIFSNDSGALQLPSQLSYALSDDNHHFLSPGRSIVPASVPCRGNANPSHQVFLFIHMYTVCV